MSAERLALLARVIALELSMSCRNQSVFGGFDRFVDRELPALQLPDPLDGFPNHAERGHTLVRCASSRAR